MFEQGSWEGRRNKRMKGRTDSRRGLTMSYHPGMRTPMLIVMGMLGALGSTNLVSGKSPFCRHISARKDLIRLCKVTARSFRDCDKMTLPSGSAVKILLVVEPMVS